MAVAVLSDDATLFSKATSLFTATTTNYFRWGRDPAFSQGRTLGECTETLRVRCGRLTHRQRERGNSGPHWRQHVLRARRRGQRHLACLPFDHNMTTAD